MSVGIRLGAIKNRKLRHVTPIRLIELGWPNQFLVNAAIDIKGKPHVSIWPCCFWMVNRRTGTYLCKAHPAEYFEMLSTERVPKASDKVAWIDTPWGRMLDIDYFQDDGPPVMTLRAFGLPLQLSGGLAKELYNGLKSKLGI
jgi:hypothetical protein